MDSKEIVATIRAINPTAQLQPTTYSKVPDLDWILDAKCYHGANDQRQQALVQEQVEELAANDNHQQHNHDHSHDHHHDHADDATSCATCQQQDKDEHVHTSGVSTIALTETGTVDWKKVHAWLAATLWPNQDEKDQVLRARLEASMAGEEPPIPTTTTDQQQIFRIKGILSVKHTPDTVLEEQEWLDFCNAETGVDRRRYILQAVYDLWDIHASLSGGKHMMFDEDDQERVCKVVVIGRHLKREELETGFRECLLD